MTQHTDACLTRHQAVKDYDAQWPNHCAECGGTGWIVWYERHDEGPGEPMSEPCEACLGYALCPRCGTDNGEVVSAEGVWLVDAPCWYCGWKNGDGGRPDAECYCDEDAPPSGTDYSQLFPELVPQYDEA